MLRFLTIQAMSEVFQIIGGNSTKNGGFFQFLNLPKTQSKCGRYMYFNEYGKIDIIISAFSSWINDPPFLEKNVYPAYE